MACLPSSSHTYPRGNCQTEQILPIGYFDVDGLLLRVLQLALHECEVRGSHDAGTPRFRCCNRPSSGVAASKELTDAEDRLKRLYRSIEDGVVELDDILRERTAALKSQRERAKAALDHAGPSAARRPPSEDRRLRGS
ncbi:hypothetical protein [Bradyrhizobium sp.]|uniref:hypothetical protein n=1 Tax=Bradyrhizobium sp. TaxID=376 RepID=UPI001EB12CBA|nr:hypothetical protein [Bradyrhizobium sp.]MBV9481005.1 hypothetical protein [Acidobacteriota bacterium]MBV9978388.1 hypothetical protein [Bradyrhizobium sp.]